MDHNTKTLKLKFTNDLVHHCVYIIFSADNVEFENPDSKTKDGILEVSHSTPSKEEVSRENRQNFPLIAVHDVQKGEKYSYTQCQSGKHLIFTDF